MRISIEDYGPPHREWARELLRRRWGSPRVVTRGRLHHADDLAGLVARVDGVQCGLVTYRIDGDGCEVVTLDSLAERCGIGTALLAEVAKRASTHCRRIWLVTTNDNTPALRFYQKRGFAISSVCPGAIEASRRLKPEIPETGIDGIPIRDEIVLERTLPEPLT